MRKNYFLLLFLSMSFFYNQLNAQCTPVDCSADLSPLGGLCDESIEDGVVNQIYSDFISFVVSNACIDGALFGQPGSSVRITKLRNFTFDNLPNGISASTNQIEYNAPAIGCAAFQGIPTQAGIFEVTVNFTADLNFYAFSSTCGGFSLPQSEDFSGPVDFVVLPDPSFTSLSSTYCENDNVVDLTPTGTSGGTFSGPGVNGNQFDPAVAGVGTHTIKYVVSAQDGNAYAPATDSSEVVVAVEATSTWYADIDGDGFGDANNTLQACQQPNGYVDNDLDCDDTNSEINPNTVWFADLDGDNYHNPEDSIVQCERPLNYILLSESLGEDCDDNNSNVLGVTTWYQDADEDGFGNPNVSVQACEQPVGYVDNNLDCDDTNPNIGAGTNVIWFADLDEDGYINPTDSLFGCSQPSGYILLDDALGVDCDDTDPNIGSAADVFYLDADGDGFGNPDIDTVACQQPNGYVNNNLDCDDTDNAINPATEWFADLDGDGYHDPNNSLVQCESPQDFILLSESLGEDCDDTDATINPETEWFADLDGDGYHDPNNSIVQCERPEDFILLSESLGEDCDDTDADFNEPLTWYEDADGDGFGNPDVSVEECEQPAGFIDNDLDCDDTNPNINPDAEEIPNNGIDENCSGSDSVTTSLNNLVVEYLNVYPNPGLDIVNIDFEVAASSSVIVEMYSLEGRTIYYESTSDKKQNISVKTNDLSSGVYIIRISDGTQSKVVKWVKM